MTDAGPPAELSVVVPCRNTAPTLPRQLDALVGQELDLPWEVVVVDNGSTDATARVAWSYRDRLPAMRVLDARGQAGRQYACNVGVRATEGRLITFVDGDDEATPGYLAGIARALERWEVVGARIDHLTLNTGWVRESASDHQTSGLSCAFGFLPYVSGGTLGVRRDVFEAIGGFGEDKLYAEDVDFCWRAQLAGFTLGLAADAVMRHSYRDGLTGMYRQHRNFGRGGALLYRQYRELGMPRRSVAAAATEWGQLVRSAAAVRDPAALARWLRKAARNIGRAQASLRWHIFYP